ncbi:MAG: Maff2 family protein [Clostridiales bacterium]|nr:Maff2 family protein [Clostridiales bacterium]
MYGVEWGKSRRQYQRLTYHYQTLVIALGAGLGIWGAINLLEGYGNDNPGAKSQGMKQLMAGGGVALIGITLVPLLSGLFG